MTGIKSELACGEPQVEEIQQVIKQNPPQEIAPDDTQEQAQPESTQQEETQPTASEPLAQSGADAEVAKPVAEKEVKATIVEHEPTKEELMESLLAFYSEVDPTKVGAVSLFVFLPVWFPILHPIVYICSVHPKVSLFRTKCIYLFVKLIWEGRIICCRSDCV
jgi:hypothetical protein